MRELAEDQHKLRAYLLGTLAAAETETYDERSLTDDRFVDALDAAERELVDAYARGELGEPEARRFESHYLASPLRREKARFAAAFQVFAEKETAAAAATAPVIARETEKEGFFAWVAAVFDRRRLSFALAAATLLLAAFGGWLMIENRRLADRASQTERRREELAAREKELADRLAGEANAGAEAARELAAAREERERLEAELAREKQAREALAAARAKPEIETKPAPPRAAAPSIASFVLAPPLRGAGDLPRLAIPRRTDLVSVGLQLEDDPYGVYRVALTDQNGRTVWRSGPLRARGGGGGRALAVRFPARLLRAEIYSLEVAGANAGGAPENFINYTFRAVLE